MAVASPTAHQKENDGFRFAVSFWCANCRMGYSKKLVLSLSKIATKKMRQNNNEHYAAGFEAASLIVAKQRS